MLIDTFRIHALFYKLYYTTDRKILHKKFYSCYTYIITLSNCLKLEKVKWFNLFQNNKWAKIKENLKSHGNVEIWWKRWIKQQIK